MSTENDHNSSGAKNPPSPDNLAVHLATIAIFVLILLIVILFQNDTTGNAYGFIKMLAGLITFLFGVFGQVR